MATDKKRTHKNKRYLNKAEEVNMGKELKAAHIVFRDRNKK
jgi:hypothetical protein